jgi:hypothetical protein
VQLQTQGSGGEQGQIPWQECSSSFHNLQIWHKKNSAFSVRNLNSKASPDKTIPGEGPGMQSRGDPNKDSMFRITKHQLHYHCYKWKFAVDFSYSWLIFNMIKCTAINDSDLKICWLHPDQHYWDGHDEHSLQWWSHLNHGWDGELSECQEILKQEDNGRPENFRHQGVHRGSMMGPCLACTGLRRDPRCTIPRRCWSTSR